jgi:hypothetical protein
MLIFIMTQEILHFFDFPKFPQAETSMTYSIKQQEEQA